MARQARRTVRDLRRENRAAILRHLYFAGSMSRRDLTDLGGVSSATVSNVITDLIADGIVTEVGHAESDGGRPQVLLSVDPDFAYIVGVDVGETRVRVELLDLQFQERAKADYELPAGRPEPGDVADLILDGLASVLANGGIAEDKVLGIGVGVPGIVEQTGLVVHAKTLGWDGVPLGDLLKAGTKLRVFADNGAKTMGQAELWFGAGQGAQHAVVTLLGTGVGASIITDGLTYRGATSSAGEWGHTTLSLNGRQCRCGAHGCLEAYVGAPGILERYAEVSAEPVAPRPEEAALTAFVLAAEESEPAAEILRETIAYLGAGLANLVNLFNPTHVILGGWVGMVLGQRHLDEIRAATAEHALPQPMAQAQILLGELGPDAVTRGAATLVLDDFLRTSSHR